ncbi:SLC13 family permease [Orrella sp. 11846]|uniref:SLC13 family permease n=1 Tax=Orrella sp. 11846 TaxID=3409913 RepID=UPI003B5913DE
MSTELLTVLSLLGLTIILFIVNRPRMDAVALIMMTALPLTGVITVEQTLSGFSDPNIILIAAMFVVAEGLVRTGIAQRLGDWLTRHAGRSQSRLIVLLMLIVGTIGAFMSSTGVVAIFIPVMLGVARSSGIAPSRLMMPLSIAALISGMMTLVATTPNLVVNAEIIRQGYEGFQFFDFTPLGVPVMLVAILYMLVARRWLPAVAPSQREGLHRPRLAQWIDEYGLSKLQYRIRVQPDSSLVGRRLDQLDLRSSQGVSIIAIERRRRFGRALLEPRASTVLQANDVLFMQVQKEQIDIRDVLEEFRLVLLPISRQYFTDQSQALGMAELMVPVNSRLLGKSVHALKFRSRYDLSVIGLKRANRPLSGALDQEALRLGDTLLVVGTWRAIRAMQSQSNDLIVLNMPQEIDKVVPVPKRAPLAILSLAITVALMVSGVVPNVMAALIGALLLGLFGCIDMPSSYRSIHWQSLILVVGMLPFSTALQNTGGISLAADLLLSVIGQSEPHVVLAALFTLTAVFGLFISNTATAILMAPIACAMAVDMGVSIYPFAMTVAIAASSAFMTPVSTPVNTLVVVPGQYRFIDFIKIGVPLTVLVMLTTVFLVPWVFPF